MKFKQIFIIILLALSGTIVNAQEIIYTMSLNTPNPRLADPQVFVSLERTVRDFLNNQKWTSEEYQDVERVKCNIQLNLVEEFSPTEFRFSVSYLATRPVYGTDYESVIFQYIDDRVVFNYEPGNALIFNPNSYNDRLTSVLGFYSYIILGLDKDSFKDHGGTDMYTLAQTVVSAMPTNIANGDDNGWSVAKAHLNKSRYSLVENLLNPKLTSFRSGFYEYHRQGLDISSTAIEDGKKNIVNAIKMFEKSFDIYTNSMIIDLIANIKSRELNEIFKPAPASEKSEVYKLLLKLNPAGAQNYAALRG